MTQTTPVELYSYEEYLAIVTNLFNDGKVTGTYQSQEYLDTTKMNLHRMKRVYKSTEISSVLKSLVDSIEKPIVFYVIAEGWCADASQNIPIIAKISELSSNIELKLLFRDANLEIMDQYLTNGGRAIPKLVAFQDDKELFTWGPRPDSIQEKVLAFKKEFPEVDKETFLKQVHKWYAKDKGVSIQNDFIKKLS